eukprot:TRINITY_DN11517_c0_g1_i1.p3 TRINITY_DN11517_c0_g1~~TRINITY_DN11517_c0_g1_i1.p3  ORF type:complete len:167 (+),score=43.93 TRINITY_DN11517_c0_g1_i1:45-503(+)
MDYDSVLAEIGEFGRWQQSIIVLLWIPPMMAGVHNLLFVFTGLTPKNGFRCQIPGCDDDEFEFSDFPADLLFPPDPDGDPDYCRFYMPSFTDQQNTTCSLTDFGSQSVKCPPGGKFVFNDFEFEETLVTKWAVCAESPLQSASSRHSTFLVS